MALFSDSFWKPNVRRPHFRTSSAFGCQLFCKLRPCFGSTQTKGCFSFPPWQQSVLNHRCVLPWEHAFSFQQYPRSSQRFFRKRSHHQSSATALGSTFFHSVCLWVRAQPVHAEKHSQEDLSVGMCCSSKKAECSAKMLSCVGVRGWNAHCVSFFLVSRASRTKVRTCNYRSRIYRSICPRKRNSACQYSYCHQIPGW